MEFPTMEQLNNMSLNQLRSLDIRDASQEAMVQTVINAKLLHDPVKEQVNIHVPDIKTKEEEIYWQKKVDEAKEASRPEAISMDSIVPDGEVEIPQVYPESLQETAKQVMAEMAEEAKLEETKRFCEFCDAKGPIAHKKVCTRPK